ncbi:bifunctional diaminohydroxyphosphoribosylaminopyrimidine deaminase/5-amino-6-(5-phosphoribosylamino)uracil reductase RibD [Candidatus Sumerlaeota bacterium]|nr:bifunctional diaminohydroxyphosphoribosylaminopyrimidine deaminase/5-amino-6-(5-phosphoribosylamino)uracil reductase RibD [Candidatus Sumerlaeota bacterium]
MSAAHDEKWMRRALELAARAKGETRPNPCVGAVIVSADGRVLGEGWHRKAGEPHAEVNAIQDAQRNGNDTGGATFYVTLEPCNHFGRTPPCTAAIIAAGARSVVIAARDPNSAAAGGAQRLRDEGIEVASGVLEDEARLLNAEFFTFHGLKRPLVTLKWAMSADGCTSLENGESRWITGETARAEVHRRRALHDAVLAGIGTVMRDNARLTARDGASSFRPMRIVLDSGLKLSPGSAFAGERDGSRAVVVAAEDAPEERGKALKNVGVEVWRLPRNDLRALLTRLHQEKIQSVVVEGGRTVAGSFIAAGLVDHVECWIAPRILGGGATHCGPIALKNPLAAMSGAGSLLHTRMSQFDGDILIEGWLSNHLFHEAIV